MAQVPSGIRSICTNLLIADVHQISFHCHFCVDEKKTTREQKTRLLGPASRQDEMETKVIKEAED